MSPAPGTKLLGAVRRGVAAARAHVTANFNGAYWPGRLSSSPFASALVLASLAYRRRGDTRVRKALDRGYAWLAASQNADGGWSDTPSGQSSLHATFLALAALTLNGEENSWARIHEAGRRFWDRAGGLDALTSFYGRDHTFLVPILSVGALADVVPWQRVPRLPIEAIVLPAWLWRLFRIPMVSFSLPMFVSIGLLRQARRSYLPSVVRRKGLRVLAEIQPAHGGYLECPVASAFVLLAMDALGHGEGQTGNRTAEFLLNSQREDGSWPIVTDLSVWSTVLILRALETLNDDSPHRRAALRWLLDRAQVKHGTCAWQWTPGPGGIPETDDTSIAMIVLSRAADLDAAAHLAGARRWLEGVQNRDGGWPTFSRGSGSLPFDRSAVDLTAHVVEGLLASGVEEDSPAVQRGLSFLRNHQALEGYWEPLWFGNPHSPKGKNRTYGTSQVLLLAKKLQHVPPVLWERGSGWLLSIQNGDGGWGSCRAAASSPEETGLAVSGLLAAGVPCSHTSITGGIEWLLREQQPDGGWRPTPIGLYYEALKYEEAAYPGAFALKALGDYQRSTGSPGSGAGLAGENQVSRVSDTAPGERAGTD